MTLKSHNTPEIQICQYFLGCRQMPAIALASFSAPYAAPPETPGNPNCTEGPISNATITVPIPAGPPSSQPNMTTVTSISVRATCTLTPVVRLIASVKLYLHPDPPTNQAVDHSACPLGRFLPSVIEPPANPNTRTDIGFGASLDK